MSNENEKKPLTLAPRGTLELNKTVDAGQVRQSFPHGKTKVVTVEHRKKRTFTTGTDGQMHQVHKPEGAVAPAAPVAPVALTPAPPAAAPTAGSPRSEGAARLAPAPPPATVARPPQRPSTPPPRSGNQPQRSGGGGSNRNAGPSALANLTTDERQHRQMALQMALKADEEARKKAAEEAIVRAAAEIERARVQAIEDAKRAAEAAAAPPPVVEAPVVVEKAPVPEKPATPEPTPTARAVTPAAGRAAHVPGLTGAAKTRAEVDEEENESRRKGPPGAKTLPGKAPVKRPPVDPKRRGKLTITGALDDEEGGRSRSLAALKRASQKEKRKAQLLFQAPERVVREIVLPETVSVQDLANRMAERAPNVIKALMRMGVMATINQVVDADTAELVVQEFGHTVRRVSEADVEVGLESGPDTDDSLVSRPPVVTVMGHVDHGKTSLLDALRQTDVVSGEAGGITQHIGAYQVTMKSGAKITFIDTPGHEAFTAMRARGAKVTDIVVLVVAADDGIMPQTIEAIRHARAADVPIVVAINKMDKHGADPERVRTALLNHEVVVEQMGGETLCIEVSAKQGTNLEKLEEAILLQSEVLDLKANPNRLAEGTVVESRIDKGRGSVATVLVKRGTLKVGDVFVAGKEWGRVRAMIDDHGNRIEAAGPATPVEIIGLQGTPSAGDDLIVLDDEGKAREIAAYRQRKEREATAVKAARGTMEQMFAKIQSGEAKEMAVVIKADVQGSVEALTGTLEKLGNETIKVRVLHGAVGALNESDVTLAKASGAIIIGFNVRANPQAREMARRDGIDIRYYSIIYDVAEDMKKALTGLLVPTFKEKFIGYADIREVFTITKVGKVAGCMVTEGVIKRGCKVRLLRDNVVIHEGDLAQLKRFKDDVKEVREGFDCGMSLVNYENIQVGDVIECFEMEEVAVHL